TERVDHELIEEYGPGPGRPHHQAGIEEPETRIVVLVTTKLVPIAIDGDASGSDLDTGGDLVGPPSHLLRWIRCLSARRAGRSLGRIGRPFGRIGFVTARRSL